jgi:hypothetical protein
LSNAVVSEGFCVVIINSNLDGQLTIRRTKERILKNVYEQREVKLLEMGSNVGLHASALLALQKTRG